MRAIVGVLNFVPDVSAAIETEPEPESETVVELNVAWPSATDKGRAQISVRQNRFTGIKPQLPRLRPQGTRKDQEHNWQVSSHDCCDAFEEKRVTSLGSPYLSKASHANTVPDETSGTPIAIL
jgi:hypothetical protein